MVRPFLDDSWRIEKALAYVRPVGWTVYGILGEGSARSTSDFYLWVVRLPLVVPTTVMNLNWSERVGGGTRTFDLRTTEAHPAIVEAIATVEAAVREAKLVPDPPGGADNVGMQEARAYGLFLEGNPGGAFEVLGRVTRYEREATRPWEQELVARAASVRSMIEQGRDGEVQDRLLQWRSASLAALGIDPS